MHNPKNGSLMGGAVLLVSTRVPASLLHVSLVPKRRGTIATSQRVRSDAEMPNCYVREEKCNPEWSLTQVYEEQGQPWCGSGESLLLKVPGINSGDDADSIRLTPSKTGSTLPSTLFA
ncbi:hypothetical protein F5Y01DRAFT_143005 [Xylaria sp. FL0043]|nr:hypothetical protein F5Y01DRAFT_143005 [Xylaria sp. FL0043]